MVLDTSLLSVGYLDVVSLTIWVIQLVYTSDYYTHTPTTTNQ